MEELHVRVCQQHVRYHLNAQLKVSLCFSEFSQLQERAAPVLQQVEEHDSGFVGDTFLKLGIRISRQLPIFRRTDDFYVIFRESVDASEKEIKKTPLNCVPFPQTILVLVEAKHVSNMGKSAQFHYA